MMEGNYSGTSLTPRSSPGSPLVFRPRRPAQLPQGCPTIQWLPDPFVGRLRDALRCVWTVEAWGEKEGKMVIFWHRIPKPVLFFSPPSCGFMAYLLVADFHLATRGDLWQICCRDFDRGSRRKGISNRASGLDRMACRS